MPTCEISWSVNPIGNYNFQSIIDQRQQCELVFLYADGSRSSFYCRIIAWPTGSSLRLESSNDLLNESNGMQYGVLTLPNSDKIKFDGIT